MPTNSFIMTGSTLHQQPTGNFFENLNALSSTSPPSYNNNNNGDDVLMPSSVGDDFVNAREFPNYANEMLLGSENGDKLACMLAQFATYNNIGNGLMTQVQPNCGSSSIWSSTGLTPSSPPPLAGLFSGHNLKSPTKGHMMTLLDSEQCNISNMNTEIHSEEQELHGPTHGNNHQFLMQQRHHHAQQLHHAFLGEAANGVSQQTAGGTAGPVLLKKKGFNMTECVPVPSSEHVAEIVGRQGCKIKALRAKTNTYIKTPVRGEEPVFVVTGRKEDVMAAKREIMSAAEHFSQIRASRKSSNAGVGCPNGGPPLLPNANCLTNNLPSGGCGGARSSEMPPSLHNHHNAFNPNGHPPAAMPSPNNGGQLQQQTSNQQQQPLLPWTTNEAPLSMPPTHHLARLAGLNDFSNSSTPPGTILINGLNHGNQCTVKVRVPYKVVGLVVGPKGATIKRIQQMTHTYIVTPSRDREPVFEITGTPSNVECARLEIENHIAVRTAAAAAAAVAGINSGQQSHAAAALLNFNTTFNNNNACEMPNGILPAPPNNHSSFNELALLNNLMNLVGSSGNGSTTTPNVYAAAEEKTQSHHHLLDASIIDPSSHLSSNTSSSTLNLQRMLLLQTLANNDRFESSSHCPPLPLQSNNSAAMSNKRMFTSNSFAMGTANNNGGASSEDDMTLLNFQARQHRLGPNYQNYVGPPPHGKRYNSDPMTTGLLPGLNESMAGMSLFQKIMENVMNENAEALGSTCTADSDLDAAIAAQVNEYNRSNGYAEQPYRSDAGLKNNDRYSQESLLSARSPASSPTNSRALSCEFQPNGARNVSSDTSSHCLKDSPLSGGDQLKSGAYMQTSISQIMEPNSVFVDNIMRVVGLASANNTTTLAPNLSDICNRSQNGLETFGSNFMSDFSSNCNSLINSYWNAPEPTTITQNGNSFNHTSPSNNNNNDNNTSSPTTNAIAPDTSLKSCLVCKVGARVAALVPCGHTMFCMDCATEAKSCPVCHRGTTQAIRIYS